MKKLLALIVLALALFVASPAVAGTKTITFAWEQPGDISDLQGWKLYVSEAAGGPYTIQTTINYDGNPLQEYQSAQPIISPDGQRKTYYFVVTAFDQSGNESGYSNEVSAIIDFEAPLLPIKLIIKVISQ